MTGCASTGNASFAPLELNLLGPGCKQSDIDCDNVFRVGDIVLATTRLINRSDTTITVSHYRAEVLAPRTINDVSYYRLTNVIVPMSRPSSISPNDYIYVDWRFEILEAMLEMPGSYRLILTFPELGRRGDVSFKVIDSSEVYDRRSDRL